MLRMEKPAELLWSRFPNRQRLQSSQIFSGGCENWREPTESEQHVLTFRTTRTVDINRVQQVPDVLLALLCDLFIYFTFSVVFLLPDNKTLLAVSWSEVVIKGQMWMCLVKLNSCTVVQGYCRLTRSAVHSWAVPPGKPEPFCVLHVLPVHAWLPPTVQWLLLRLMDW